MNARGQYGDPRFGSAIFLIGRELTDAEIREAREAANQATAVFTESRNKLTREWPVTLPLTKEQMTGIMKGALALAQETERNLVEMIDKVPEHWEHDLRMELGPIRRAIAEAPGFQTAIDSVKGPTVLPGFYNWIERLLQRTDHGMTAIAHAWHLLPDWLRMRKLLSGLREMTYAAINALVRGAKAAGGLVSDVAEGAAGAVKALPTIVKVAGGAVLVVAGVWAISKLGSVAGASK